ncbi:MAG: hypothetical protein ACLVAW_27470 [Eisenbergiella massiliensis]
MSDWVEYLTCGGSPMSELRRKRLSAALEGKILGVGNENWGCGGI